MLFLWALGVLEILYECRVLRRRQFQRGWDHNARVVFSATFKLACPMYGLPELAVADRG